MSSPLLEVKDLQVTVGEEQKVLLDGLNLTIYPGETHVLMGHNGAGKSTLMSALMGDPRYTVTRGQIIFKGQDVTHEPADVRAKLGMFLSFQTPEEIPGITLENFLRTAQNAITGKPVKVFAFRKELAQQMGESPATIQRYKTLNKLVPELQNMVDEGKIPVNTGADIAQMKPKEQKVLADAIQKESKVPSGTKAKELKKESQAGSLTTEKIVQAVAPTKREEMPPLKVTMLEEDLRPFFPDKRTTIPDVKQGILEGLKLRQTVMERQKAKAAAGKSVKKAEAPVR